MSSIPPVAPTLSEKIKLWFGQWPPWIAAAIGFGIGFVVAKIL